MRDRARFRVLIGAGLLGSALLGQPILAPAQVTITETVTPSLGTLMGGPANRRFILNTNGTVTGPNAADYLFGAVSGELTFQRQGGQIPVFIVADNIMTTGGVTANSILCKWHNTPEVACDGTGIVQLAVGRRRLLLGVDITTTQFHTGGDTASISFDITATFL
jgi:hypothetical protein